MDKSTSCEDLLFRPITPSVQSSASSGIYDNSPFENHPIVRPEPIYPLNTIDEVIPYNAPLQNMVRYPHSNGPEPLNMTLPRNNHPEQQNRDPVQNNNFSKTKKPNEWDPEELVKYIKYKDPDLVKYTHLLLENEFDGNSFTLLSIPTMLKYLNIKLGPALKLEAIINKLKETQHQTEVRNSQN